MGHLAELTCRSGASTCRKEEAVSSDKPFNQAEYWIDRHRKLQGDPRSVGNLGKSVEDNIRGEDIFKRHVGHVARLLAPICSSVLDLGCGYGRAANELLGRGFDYCGIDVSPDAIREAQKNNPKGTFLRMDLNEWEPEEKFDVVCAFYILVHFVDDEKWSLFLDKALRSVNSHGYFVFADEFPTERTLAGPHVVARPLSHYATHLSRHGFAYDTELKAAFVGASQSRVSQQFHFARRS